MINGDSCNEIDARLSKDRCNVAMCHVWEETLAIGNAGWVAQCRPHTGGGIDLVISEFGLYLRAQCHFDRLLESRRAQVIAVNVFHPFPHRPDVLRRNAV